MGKQRLIALGFALVCGILAVTFAVQWRSQQLRKVAALEQQLRSLYREPIAVVVAAKELPENTVLEMAHLTTANVPEEFVQPYAVRAPNDLLGKITAAPMAAGEQVLLNKLRRPEEGQVGTLSTVMPKGKRAVTITVDAITGVGGFVRPGDMVDVLWTVKTPQAGTEEGQIITFTLFQDVPALAIGRESVGGSSGAPKGQGQEDASAYLVTLALTPQEAALLLYVREQGRIQLSLRPRGDKGQQVKVAPANMNTLMESVLGKEAAHQPPPKSAHAVEIYKGPERSVVTVNE
jgi:pilus assembly protein CpaB